jgi:uncharacterized membrane protein
VDAGLITEAQADSIDAYEDERRSPALIRSVSALAGLAIGIGVLSIVAANWDAIPGRVKIAVDLALLVAVAIGVTILHGRRPDASRPWWPFETALIVLDLWVLASIALVGQVYQLGGELHEALVIWTGLTAALMSRAQSQAGAFAWILGLQMTWASWAVWFADDVEIVGADFPETLAAGSLGWVALATVVASRSTAIQTARPQLARVASRVGWAEVVAGATLGTMAFYDRTNDDFTQGWWLASAGAAALVAWVWTTLGSSRSPGTARALLVACWLAAYVPAAISPGDLDVLAALTFIGLWGVVARHAHSIGDARLLNTATAVIGLRLVIVYFEVFGSLLDTGLGLVGGGMLTLLLVWLWTRKRRDFERSLEGTEGRA